MHAAQGLMTFKLHVQLSNDYKSSWQLSHVTAADAARMP